MNSMTIMYQARMYSLVARMEGVVVDNKDWEFYDRSKGVFT